MKDPNRYIRQKALPQVGASGQEKLSKTRVLVIGCGGLGTAVLPYLAAAGVGTLGLVDGDTISLNNLHRQVLYKEQEIGTLKVDSALKTLRQLTSEIQINTYPHFLTVTNAVDLFTKYDIIVDATDRIPARYLINDACVLTGKPFVHAAVHRFQSQVSVFNYQNGPTYRCLYPSAPLTTQSCDSAGILGSTVAMVGGLQANEVFKIILNTGTILSGQLLVNDFLTHKQSIFKFSKNEEIIITHDFFEKEHHVKVRDYAFAKAQKSFLIDLRTPSEQPQLLLTNGIQIPLAELSERMDRLPKEGSIGLFCKSGTRSKEAYKLLKNAGITQLFCLQETAAQLYEKINHV